MISDGSISGPCKKGRGSTSNDPFVEQKLLVFPALSYERAWR